MNRISTWSGLIVLAVAASVFAQQPAQNSGSSVISDLGRQVRERQSLAAQGEVSPVQQWLNQNIESVSWDEELFEDVIRWMRELPGQVNIVVEWYRLEGAGVDREAPITLELRNVPLFTVLNLALKQAGVDEPLAYYGIDNILTITTQDEMNQPENFVIRTYNVVDLIRLLRNFSNAPSIRLSNLQEQSSGQGAGGQNLFSDDDDDDDDDDYKDRVQEVIDLITDTIEPSSWSVSGGLGTIAAHQDTIVVNNSISVHEKLGGPVRLREMQTP